MSEENTSKTTTIFPFKDIEPFSDSTHPMNMKSRTVYCKYCRYSVNTDLPGPRCGKCKAYLINVPRYEELLK